MILHHFRLLLLAAFFALGGQCFAAPLNAWHIPSTTQTGLSGTMRDPYVEIGSSSEIVFYQGAYLGDGANETGGKLWYRNATTNGAWISIPLVFHSNQGSNQFWRTPKTGDTSPPAAPFNTSAFGSNDVIEYYFEVTASNRDTTFLYGGDLDGNNRATTDVNIAKASPYSIRSRAAWIFHSNNRVVVGSDVQFWAKVGYIGDVNNVATKWTTNGAVYYTTDGSNPAPGTTPGTAANGSTTQVATFAYDHPEQNRNDSQSIAGTPMWWVATAANLPSATTIKYKIGFWNAANGEQKFADHNAATDNATFSFSIGAAGDPVLMVNGANANYTTSHVFVDETKGTSAPFNITFEPGKPNVTAAEVFTNLNRRDKVSVVTNGFEEGIKAPDGNTISAGDDTHYWKAYPMNNAGGSYTLTLSGSNTGAYRLTARFKVSDAIAENNNDPNNWIWYTSSGRRDHAIVVSPVDSRDINLYEINVFNIEATGSSFAQRSTWEDLYDAPNAPHQGAENRWNLDYLKSLGCNWLWFQPIHPAGITGRENVPNTTTPYDPGSPYAVKNFFEINPLASVNFAGSSTDFGALTSVTNRAAAMAAFQGFVSAADNKGVGVMLDAPFNHTAFDVELARKGVELFTNSDPNDIANQYATIASRELRFFSRNGDYGQRADLSNPNVAAAPDRGDFGKWNDVKDVFFGRYAALVTTNPGGNGNYLNESDTFDYTSFDGGDGAVTANVWKYFAEYTLFWLDKTGVPAGADLATQTARGIDGLRADFGQGLPPQVWEYIINKTRTRKWNFVFMTESLDGGAVTYRSNRHFDILNENIVFPLQAASSATDYRNIFEGRRNAYGQSLVLLNSTSHDEENYVDPFQALVRYTVTNSVDGAPLIFPGQELGISRTFGYEQYETNFGKQIAHFKSWNSMLPAWNKAASSDSGDFGLKQLRSVYSAIGQARQFSRALRSANRYFLDQTGGTGAHAKIFSVAKYETANTSPSVSDVVFAFANIDRDNGQSGNFNVNVTQNGSNLFGIKFGRTYNTRNIAAYTGIDSARRDTWLWGANGRTGDDVLNNGVFVAMNKVPTDNGSWSTAPYEAQYLKLYDVTAPANAPMNAAGPRVYDYVIGNTATFTWSAAAADSEGITPQYAVTVTINGTNSQTLTTGTTSYSVANLQPGQQVSITVKAANPNDPTKTSTGSTTSHTIKVLDANGDEDGDGLKNSAEDTAGTNPLDNADVFAVTAVTKLADGSVQVTWRSVPGKKYQLEAASDLTTGFAPLSDVFTAGADETTMSYTESGATGARKFYRVKIVP